MSKDQIKHLFAWQRASTDVYHLKAWASPWTVCGARTWFGRQYSRNYMIGDSNELLGQRVCKRCKSKEVEWLEASND